MARLRQITASSSENGSSIQLYFFLFFWWEEQFLGFFNTFWADDMGPGIQDLALPGGGEQRPCSSQQLARIPLQTRTHASAGPDPWVHSCSEKQVTHISLFISFRSCCSGSAQPSGACTFFAIGPFRWLENASTKGNIWKILIENIWDVTSHKRPLLFCGCWFAPLTAIWGNSRENKFPFFAECHLSPVDQGAQHYRDLHRWQQMTAFCQLRGFSILNHLFPINNYSTKVISYVLHKSLTPPSHYCENQPWISFHSPQTDLGVTRWKMGLLQ